MQIVHINIFNSPIITIFVFMTKFTAGEEVLEKKKSTNFTQRKGTIYLNYLEWGNEKS